MNGLNHHGNVHCLVLFKPKSTANISYGSNTLKQEILRKYRRIRNEIHKITRQIHKEEQIEVAKAAKSNPKKFWAYIRNKTSLKTTIGDIKTNINPFTPANCSRTDITDPTHTKCVLKMNTVV